MLSGSILILSLYCWLPLKMAFSYYAVTDTIFKIFFQSCCYEVVKNDKKSFVRSKLLIVYCIGILAVIFWLHYETGFLNNMFLEFTSIVYFAFLILSIVISIIKDVEYCEMLELIKKTKTELTSEAQSKKINYPIIAWILVMLLFYFYPLLTGLQSFYYYFVHGIPTAVPLSLHLVMHTVSFGKLVFIIDEFTDLSKEINKQTKEHILQPVMMKKLCIAQSDLEEMFVNLNEILNPTLFVNLAVNFFCVFLQPYFIFDSLVTIPLLWTTIFNVKFLSEFIKLCLFSYVFQKLNSAVRIGIMSCRYSVLLF